MAVFRISRGRNNKPMRTAESLYEDTCATSRAISDILSSEASRPSFSYIRMSEIDGRITSEPLRGLRRRSVVSNGVRPSPKLQRLSQPTLSSTSKRRSSEFNNLNTFYRSPLTSTISGYDGEDRTPVPVVLKCDSIRPDEPRAPPAVLGFQPLSRACHSGVL